MAALRHRAIGGDVVAQTLWAQALLDGTQVSKDAARARQWFTIAADAGFAPALNMLGRCLERGWGGTVDLPEAARFYAAAIVRGDDWARYNLGNMRLRGRGIDRDRAEAFALFTTAAQNGHAKSMNLAARCLEEGWGCTQNGHAAAAWYARSAEAGDYRGQHNFAVLLAEAGRLPEAFVWWDRALADATPDILDAMQAILDGIDMSEAHDLACRAAARANALHAALAANGT